MNLRRVYDFAYASGRHHCQYLYLHEQRQWQHVVKFPGRCMLGYGTEFQKCLCLQHTYCINLTQKYTVRERSVKAHNQPEHCSRGTAESQRQR